MTQKQKWLYINEWNDAKKAGALKESDRHALHIKALGEDKSSKDFSNDDLDKVLAEFRAISKPDSLNDQIRQQEQNRTRLDHRIADQIKCLALFVEDPDKYLRLIFRDRFHVEQVDDLTDTDLGLLRNTISARLSMMRRTAVTTITEHEMCERAGVQCFRKPCAQCRQRDAAPHMVVMVEAAPSSIEEVATVAAWNQEEDNPF
jgi:hypothetical protein